MKFTLVAGIAGIAQGAIVPAASGTSAVPSVSTTNAARVGFPVATPVAAADTPVTVVDLGIAPAVLRVPIKGNTNFTPNVTNVILQAEAKFAIYGQELEKRARVGFPIAAAASSSSTRASSSATSATAGIAGRVGFPAPAVTSTSSTKSSTSATSSSSKTSSSAAAVRAGFPVAKGATSSSSSITSSTSSKTTIKTSTSVSSSSTRSASTSTSMTSSTRSSTTSALPSSSSKASSSSSSSTSITPSSSSKVISSTALVSTTTSSKISSSTSVPVSTSITKSSTAISTTTSAMPTSTSAKTSSTLATSSRTSSSAYPVLSLAATNIQLDSEFLSEISIGTDGDTLDVIMDTGSSDLWMFSTDCQNCNNTAAKAHDYYHPLNSTAFVNTTTPFRITYGDGSSTSGLLGFDTVSVAGAPIQAQAIDLAHTISSGLQTNAMDGILGLGFPNLMSVQSSDSVTTPITNMVSQKLIPTGQFGLQYIKSQHWSYSGGGGQWTFGGYDSSVISGSLNTIPLTQAKYYMVNLNGYSIGSAFTSTTSKSVIIDSGTTLILLDTATVAQIHSYLPGGRQLSNGQWQIFCNASSDAYKGTRNAYFNFGGVQYGVPAADLTWFPQDSEYCYSGIQSWSGPFGIMGAMWLKNVYVVFDQTNKAVKIAHRTDVATLSD